MRLLDQLHVGYVLETPYGQMIATREDEMCRTPDRRRFYWVNIATGRRFRYTLENRWSDETMLDYLMFLASRPYVHSVLDTIE